MLNYILLLIGFVCLIKGADVFVESSSNVARKFNIPSVIIGMTIVAMGTSAPELSVSIQSALSGMNDMSVANVVGSNLFNILMVLGIASFFNKLKINNYSNIFFMLAVNILLFHFIADGSLSIRNGLGLFIAFLLFIYNMIKDAKDTDETATEPKQQSLIKSIILSIIGLIAVIKGGDFVVNSASTIALSLGMSESLVGLTIVAVGTSLPELVTSVIATKKGEVDIAVGNVIGSNIFNILLILGTTSVIHPIPVSPIMILDTFIMLLVTIFIIFNTHKNKDINRVQGLIYIIIYVAYIIFSIIR